jgi:tetratricopeptide (TPR) repeat protein
MSAERFEREIKVAASLQQANIVPVLSAGETVGLPYYTMPFVEGEGLRERLRTRGPLPINEAVSVLRDVARALGYAHERGIVHRDIKPDNVLLSAGAAVVTDFGIAKAISASRTDSGGATLTQLGTSIGTPAYISPEQAAGDPDVDQRADIYSFGCMAYELLAGQPPFTNRTPQRLMAAHMSEKPQPVLELRPDTPAVLAAMVMRCLEKDASARPQTAAELFAALEATSTSDAGYSAMPAVLLGGRGMLWKALVMYATAFVAVAVLAKAAIVGIGLPDWVFPGALVVMALGLPVILFTAYTQYVAHRAFTTSPTFTPGGTASIATHGTMATIAIKASPHVSWRRTMLGGIYAVVAFVTTVGVFMLLRALGIGPAGSLISAGTLKTREPLLITDFAVTNTDSALGAVVSDAVRAALSDSRVITLVSPAAIAATLRQMQRPPTSRVDLTLAREIAQRQGIKAVIDGKVTGVAGGYILTLQLLHADSGRQLASFRETGDGPRGLIDAADKLARALRGKIGESLRSVRETPPLAEATTSSLDALRKFSAALRANQVQSQYVKAVALAREAVAADSTFASAWRLMAIAMNNARMPQAPKDSAIERAYRYSDKLPEVERLNTVAAYYFTGPHRDRAKAVAAYEALIQKDDRVTANNLGLILLARGEYARAESLFSRDVRFDSSFMLGYFNAAEAQLAQGKTKQAESTLALARRRAPENARLLRTTSLALYAQGRLDDAERVLDTLRTSTVATLRADGATFGTIQKARLARLRGRYAEARRLDREASVAFAAQGAPRIALIDSLDALNIDVWFHGPSERLVRAVDSTLAALPLNTVAAVDRPYFLAARVFALAGRPDKAHGIIQQYRREVADTAQLRLQEPELHAALGEIALAERKAPTAAAEFRRGDIDPSDGAHTGCEACLAFNLGRVFDVAEMPDSAIIMYEQYLANVTPRRILDLDHFALAGTYKRLGELYEAKGERQKALSHYARFVELWKNADAEFQPRVAEVKRRIARLGDLEKR